MADFQTEFLFELSVDLDRPLDLGATPHGHRLIYYVTGGSFEGPKLRGEVLPGGGDWFRLRSDGVGENDIRATIRTDDGALIYMTYRGIFLASPEVWQRIREGKTVDPSEYYFRVAPMYETASEKYGWMNRIVAVGIGRVKESSAGVAYKVYAVR